MRRYTVGDARIFYEDIQADHKCRGQEHDAENWEDVEDEYLARAVYEQMQLTDDQAEKAIWCPICKQGKLLENNQLIFCNSCLLRLSKGIELSLESLQARLAGAHADHLEQQGCKSKPKFCLQTHFGLTALYISCLDCKLFEIVI